MVLYHGFVLSTNPGLTGFPMVTKPGFGLIGLHGD